ncbi:uncharacterized protein LOC135808554 isoform X2 [Sycon ciliatum]|uniref:uncharacterized protein LOC135808554 isoform X2 n=1 Tax=Sycon ciliatum TaxID=27933 RepID=UPI0031F686A4
MAEIDGIEAGRRLKRHHDALLADMNPIKVMDHLMTPDLLKDEVVQNVSAATREHGQIEGSRRLLEYLRPLVRHQPRALDEIIAALRRASTEHLADLLAQPLSPIRPELELGKEAALEEMNRGNGNADMQVARQGSSLKRRSDDWSTASSPKRAIREESQTDGQPGDASCGADDSLCDVGGDDAHEERNNDIQTKSIRTRWTNHK